MVRLTWIQVKGKYLSLIGYGREDWIFTEVVLSRRVDSGCVAGLPRRAGLQVSASRP